MRILLASDLHMEFHMDRGKAVAEELKNDVDVLVLAGDICVVANDMSGMEILCDRFKRIVFVAGNHEYYGGHPLQVNEALAEFADLHKNFTWLERGRVEIDGVSFAGATLWFPEPSHPYTILAKRRMSDFSVIHGLEPWVYEQNAAAVAWMENLPPTDFVISHHLPHEQSIARRFAGDALNAFFLCDVSAIIAEKKPKVWAHGHTHDSHDYIAEGGTRILCNPMGYPLQPNADFRADRVVELP